MQTETQSFQAQGNLLFRPRVDGLLDNACRKPLVVVTAGTGYGKSRAVHDYLAHRGAAHIWLQLTPLDNYTSRFWEIYTHAVRAKSPELARLMTSTGFPDTYEKTYQFLHELSRSIYSQDHCYLVLDDFHKIEDKSIINLIESIAHANLENFTVLLLSRYPLGIDYGSLYDNGLLARVSVADLRFTPEETAAYFRGIGLDFSDEVLHNIQQSTEGWPLALYLIGLHRQHDGQLFNDPIECTIPLLYSLMEVDIFSAYDEETKRCFIKLALLDSIPAELVKTLCGPHYAQVSALLRSHHFVYYNAHVGQYHFHRLYRRFLQSKKGVFTRAELAETYSMAGDWYAARNKIVEAADYYSLCQNYESMWNMIRRYGEYGYSEETARLCLQKCEKFPPAFVEQHPLIPIFKAHLILNIGEVERAHQSLLALVEEYESLPRTPARSALLGEAHIALAHTSIFKNDYAFADHYRKAVELLPEGSSILTQNHEYVGNHNALFIFDNKPGSVQAMVDLLLEIRPDVSRILHRCGYGMEYLAAAEGAFFAGRLDDAGEYLYQALYRAREADQHDIVCACHIFLMRISFARGDYGKTRGHLQRLREYAATVENHYLYGMDDIGEAWFYAAIGQPGRVPRWILAHDLNPKAQAPISRGLERIVHATILLEGGQFEALLPMLDDMEALYANAYFSRLHTRVLRALCHYRQENLPAALDAFADACDMARPNHLVMQFIEHGNDMNGLVACARSLQPARFDPGFMDELALQSAAYAKKRAYIIGAYEKEHQLQPADRPTLTAREKEVLAGLCKGSVREEIATQLDISVNTIKSLLKSIYTKLGALNRADAVRIALENSLLEP